MISPQRSTVCMCTSCVRIRYSLPAGLKQLIDELTLKAPGVFYGIAKKALIDVEAE